MTNPWYHYPGWWAFIIFATLFAMIIAATPGVDTYAPERAVYTTPLRCYVDPNNGTQLICDNPGGIKNQGQEARRASPSH